MSSMSSLPSRAAALPLVLCLLRSPRSQASAVGVGLRGWRGGCAFFLGPHIACARARARYMGSFLFDVSARPGVAVLFSGPI